MPTQGRHRRRRSESAARSDGEVTRAVERSAERAGAGAREADPGEGGARGCARGGRQPAQRRAQMVGARRRPARIRERPGGGAARG